MHNSCIFCKIRDQQVNTSIIFENNDVFVIKDIAPKAPSHYLIITKKHLENVNSIAERDQSLSYNFFAAAQYLCSRLSGDQSYRLVVNTGASAGQSVFHLHMHFLAGGGMSKEMLLDL